MRTTTDRGTTAQGHLIAGGRRTRRGCRCSLLLGSCLALAVAGSRTPGQDLTVSSGTITGNATAATFNTICVSGTASDGTRSTYNADAPLTVTDHVTVSDAGIFNVNSPVSIGNELFASYTGTLPSGLVRLNTSGTLSTVLGLFVGPGSLVQSGGNYSLSFLQLANAGAIDYQTNDLISSQVDLFDSTLRLGQSLDIDILSLSGSTAALVTNGQTFSTSFLRVGGGAAFTLTSSGSINAGGVLRLSDGSVTLDRDVSGFDQMLLIGSGASISGTGRYETVDLFASGGADVPFRAGDAIANTLFLFDATINNVTGTTLSTGQLLLSGSTAAVAGTGNYAVQSLFLINGASLVFDSADSVSGSVNVVDSTLVLDADLVTTAIDLSGPAAGLLGPHDYRVEFPSLANSSLSYDGGDSITHTVSVSSGTLALDKDLTLAYGLRLDSATLSGSGRYTAEGVVLTSGTLAYRAGDSITNYVFLSDGGTLVLERSLDVSSLSLSGTSTISGSHAYTTPQVRLSNRATLDYDPGDSITGAVTLVDSVLTLNRDLALSGTLNLSGTGASLAGTGAYVVQNLFLDNTSLTVRPGDAIANTVTVVDGVLTLDTALSLAGPLSLNGPLTVISGTGLLAVNGLTVANGAALTARGGDAISGDVFLQSGGDLVAQTPLALDSLFIDAGVGSVLTLQSFTGTGPVGGWGLAVDSDRTGDFASFLADGRLLTPGAPDGVTTTFDAGSNRTFLVAVPEPTTWALAAVGTAALVVRRCRTRSRSRRQG